MLACPRNRGNLTQPWGTRKAGAEDAATLARLFNAHMGAGRCPDQHAIIAWTGEKARRFLEVHTGTIILERHGSPVGFCGIIDYSDSKTTSRIAPGVDPEIRVFAIDRGALDSPGDENTAAKTLGLSVGLELKRLGFSKCRARILPERIFDGWYEGHMSVRREESSVHEVVFNIDEGLASVESELS